MNMNVYDVDSIIIYKTREEDKFQDSCLSHFYTLLCLVVCMLFLWVHLWINSRVSIYMSSGNSAQPNHTKLRFIVSRLTSNFPYRGCFLYVEKEK